jgi:beta-lactamase class A
MVIYKKMAKHAIVSPQASTEMIEILKDQKFNEIIPAYLPDDVKVAHKTGVITALHHDSGIVMLPDGRQYVLILLSKELGDFDSGTERMAKVSKLIYDHTTN